MGRTFEARRSEHGIDIVDDEGVRWAAVDHAERDAGAVAEAYLAVARTAYGHGGADADRAHEGRFAFRRGRTPGGVPTWDVALDGDAGRVVASERRSRLDINAPHGARRLLGLANDVYAVAQADRALRAAPAPIR